MTDYGGEPPPDYDAIRALPGVGDYTARAIASIAFWPFRFRQWTAMSPPPLLRVISRILGDGRDIGLGRIRKNAAWGCC